MLKSDIMPTATETTATMRNICAVVAVLHPGCIFQSQSAADDGAIDKYASHTHRHVKG